MSDSVRTKLKASSSGQSMRKRRSPKQRYSKKKEQAQPKQRVSIEEIAATEYDTSVEEHANILFKPNPGPQTEFLAAAEREVLYGGSAGGGKSYAMLSDPLR